MLLDAIAALPVIIWIYLLSARCRFPGLLKPVGTGNKRVIAIVPARNEVETIGRCVISLLQQGLTVVLADDASTDGTADAARAAAQSIQAEDRFIVLLSKPLPAGWTGKLWAVSQGIEVAGNLKPDYLLLADADIVHGRADISTLVAIAEMGRFDLSSYMVKLACSTFAEKALIPAFVFFFFLLYPPHWVADPKRRTAGAAGGCMLIRPEALKRIGGIEAIRNEVIDDCALARAVKSAGGRVWLGLTDETFSFRSYETFGEIGRMISRTAFNQLHHSIVLLGATLIGLFITYVLPVLLLFTGRVIPAVMGFVGWLLMSAGYARMVRFYRLPPWWSLTLPLIAVFYAGATVHSAIQYWRGHGGTWKGRAQDVKS